MQFTMNLNLSERDHLDYTKLILAIARSLRAYRDAVAQGNQIMGEDTGLVMDELGLTVGSWEVTDLVPCAKCGKQAERKGTDSVEDWDGERTWFYCSEECYEKH
jgi:hypothetical protein